MPNSGPQTGEHALRPQPLWQRIINGRTTAESLLVPRWAALVGIMLALLLVVLDHTLPPKVDVQLLPVTTQEAMPGRSDLIKVKVELRLIACRGLKLSIRDDDGVRVFGPFTDRNHLPSAWSGTQWVQRAAGDDSPLYTPHVAFHEPIRLSKAGTLKFLTVHGETEDRTFILVAEER